MNGRRTLSFTRLDEVMPEVDRLLAGHTTVGNWTLGQICNHLAGAVHHSIEGFPTRAPWLFRHTIGPRLYRHIDRTGRMRTGVRTPEGALPRPGLDDHAEAGALRASLRLFNAHSGPMAEHPFFGRMTRAMWTRFHCVHCAHHLSFALPTGPGEAGNSDAQ